MPVQENGNFAENQHAFADCRAAARKPLAPVKVGDTVESMIRAFRHGGLEKFFKAGGKAGIQPGHAKRLRLQLTALNEAQSPSDMNLAGWWFHALSTDMEGHYAVTVSRMWRLTFAWDGSDAILLDYQDCHD